MKKDEITPDTIAGEWDWREISAFISKQWVVMSKLYEGEHVWRFGADGVMISHEHGRMKYVVKYRFDHDKLRLVLNGHTVDDEGKPHTLIQERYRVEFKSPSELVLYDLEDVLYASGGESLRLRFRRISGL